MSLVSSLYSITISNGPKGLKCRRSTYITELCSILITNTKLKRRPNQSDSDLIQYSQFILCNIVSVACIIHGITAPKWSKRIKSLTFGEPAPRARLKPEHGGEQRRRGGVVHRHQRTLHAAERRNRHPAPPNLSKGEGEKKNAPLENQRLEATSRSRGAGERRAAGTPPPAPESEPPPGGIALQR